MVVLFANYYTEFLCACICLDYERLYLYHSNLSWKQTFHEISEIIYYDQAEAVWNMIFKQNKVGNGMTEINAIRQLSFVIYPFDS